VINVSLYVEWISTILYVSLKFGSFSLQHVDFVNIVISNLSKDAWFSVVSKSPLHQQPMNWISKTKSQSESSEGVFVGS